MCLDVDIKLGLAWSLTWDSANLQCDLRLMCASSSVISLSNLRIRASCVSETNWDQICRRRRADVSDECINRLRMFGLGFTAIQVHCDDWNNSYD
jgi:hypothetical protein